MPHALVVGAGIAGYTAAVLLSKRGFTVTVFEKHLVGGECTNYGCAPAKALLHYAKLVEEARRLGLEGEPGKLLEQGLREAARIAGEERAGIESLLERAGVELVRAEAKVRLSSETVVVESKGRTYKADYVVIASGSEPFWPPWIEKCSNIVDNRGFFTEGVAGDNIAVIGGGFIGVEAAQALGRLGFNVTVYEAMPQLLPGFEKDLATIAKRVLRMLNVQVYTSTPVEHVKCSSDGVEVCARGGCRRFDAALVALGRRPVTNSVEAAPLSEKGFIIVDETNRVRGFRNVYAVGDVAGPPLLAHKAVAESLTVTRHIAGEDAVRPKVIPMVVYGEPELVQVEHPEAAKAKTRVLRLPWGYNVVARIRGVRAQLVQAKIVYEEATGRILAAYVAGPNASELAGYLAFLIEKGVRVEELRNVVHPHPSASESLWEAILLAFNEAFNRV